MKKRISFIAVCMCLLIAASAFVPSAELLKCTAPDADCGSIGSGTTGTVYAAEAGSKGFSDVKAGAWYAGTVAKMTAAGVLSGYPDGTFRPQKTISAAEFVAIVSRCAGNAGGENIGADGGSAAGGNTALGSAAYENGAGQGANSSVNSAGSSQHWASPQLETALNAGWYDWDEIPPTGEKHNLPISRQLAVKILMKALLPDAHGNYSEQAPKIKDLSDLDGRYYDAVFAAYDAGITEGDNTGSFHAKDGLTRAEACAIIERAADIAGSLSGALQGNQQPGNIPPLAGGSNEGNAAGTGDENGTGSDGNTPIKGGVSENGWLQVKGTALCNESGERIVLHGMSSHGIQWYPQFASKQAIENTAAYGANLYRIAMYTGEGGYISSPDAVKKQTLAAADAAIASDMYVIIDWHILSDGNPMTYKEQAKTFFNEVSKRYADEPAVIYEICNEPNGNVSWERDIKPYAEEVISVIRKNSPNSIILIGSGTWSQDVHTVAADPINGKNLMYTCHFYAGTHGKWLRDRIDSALSSGIPIFVSEWGTSAADGNGGVFLKESKEWINFMNSRGLSWANWSLCDKGETSAALKPGTSPNAKWTENDLSESGKFVFSQF